jgi:hypothetical protein
MQAPPVRSCTTVSAQMEIRAHNRGQTTLNHSNTYVRHESPSCHHVSSHDDARVCINRFFYDRMSVYWPPCSLAFFAERPWYQLGLKLFGAPHARTQTIVAFTSPYSFTAPDGSAFLGVTYIAPFAICSLCSGYALWLLQLSSDHPHRL